jgi:hypothetical protein
LRGGVVFVSARTWNVVDILQGGMVCFKMQLGRCIFWRFLTLTSGDKGFKLVTSNFLKSWSDKWSCVMWNRASNALPSLSKYSFADMVLLGGWAQIESSGF